MKTKIFLPDMTLAIFNGQWVFVCTHAHSLIVALATSLEKTCTVALTQEIVLLKTLKMNMKYFIKVLAHSTDKGSSKLCLNFEGRNKIGLLFHVLEGGGAHSLPWTVGGKLIKLCSVQVAACIMLRKFRNVSIAPECKIFCRCQSCCYATIFAVSIAVSNAIISLLIS